MREGNREKEGTGGRTQGDFSPVSSHPPKDSKNCHCTIHTNHTHLYPTLYGTIAYSEYRAAGRLPRYHRSRVRARPKEKGKNNVRSIFFRMSVLGGGAAGVSWTSWGTRFQVGMSGDDQHRYLLSDE